MIDHQQWKASGNWRSWRGYKIFCKDEGSGPVLLFIHGFPTSSWDWHLLWPIFSRTHRVVTLDMLGFGFSDKPENFQYSVTEQAKLIEDVLENMRIDRVSIIAHDYGDSVAQELLVRFEERKSLHTDIKPKIDAICFLNGGLFPETHRPLLVQKLLASKFGNLFANLTTRWMFIRNLAPPGSLWAA